MSNLKETRTGLVAQLNLAGPACDAFGKDVNNLTLEVTYETNTRYVCGLCSYACTHIDAGYT